MLCSCWSTTSMPWPPSSSSRTLPVSIRLAISSAATHCSHAGGGQAGQACLSGCHLGNGICSPHNRCAARHAWLSPCMVLPGRQSVLNGTMLTERSASVHCPKTIAVDLMVEDWSDTQCLFIFCPGSIWSRLESGCGRWLWRGL